MVTFDPILINALIGIIIGGAASAFGATLGWLSSGDAFIPRKFATGILTGTVAGVIIGFGSIPLFNEVETSTALLIVYGEIFGTALAAVFLVPKVSGAVSTRAVEQVVEEVEESNTQESILK